MSLRQTLLGSVLSVGSRTLAPAATVTVGAELVRLTAVKKAR